MLVNIQGHSNLAKDTKSGVVINNNDRDFIQAKEMKKKVLKSMEKQIETERRLRNIEEKLELILSEKEKHGRG